MGKLTDWFFSLSFGQVICLILVLGAIVTGIAKALGGGSGD
jgi:hypothetical protein